MFVDPDDWVADNYVERFYTTIIEHNADLVLGDYISVVDGKEILMNPLGKNLPQDTDSIKRLRLNYGIYIWQCIYKRNLFFDYNLFFPEGIQLNEDIAISASLFLAAKKIIKIDEYLYFYRITSNSSSHEKDINRAKMRFSTAVMSFENLKRIDTNNDYTKDIVQSFIKAYYIMPIYHSMGSYDKVLYDDINYAVDTVTKYVSKEELNAYVSSLPTVPKFIFKLVRINPWIAVQLYSLVKWIHKFK